MLTSLLASKKYYRNRSVLVPRERVARLAATGVLQLKKKTPPPRVYPNISIDNNDIITRPQSSTFFLYIFFEIFFFLCNYSTVTAGSINKTRKPVVVVPAYNNNRVRPIDEHFASGPFLDQFDNTLDGLSNITYNNITSDHSYNPYFTCVSSG